MKVMVLRKFFRSDILIPLIFGLLLVGEGINLLLHRVELDLPEERVGPDVYPIVLGLLIVCCGLAEYFTAGFRFEEKDRSDEKQKGVFGIFILLVAYVVVLPFLGFTFSTALFLFSFALLIPKYSWVMAIAMAVIVTLGYYIIFWEVAQVVLPRGIVGF